MAYFIGLDQPPFQTGGGNTARNAKSFLRSPAGSWQRNPAGPTNVIWNGQDGTVALMLNESQPLDVVNASVS